MAVKADIQELATWLGGGLANSTTLGRYIDDAIEMQARTHLWAIEATTLATEQRVSKYTLPEEVVNVIAVFYDDRQLFNEESKASLESLNRHWRDDVGLPVGYLLDDDAQDDLVIYPAPANAPLEYMSTDMPFPPPGYLLIVHTLAGPDLPEFATLPLALRSLVGEFSQDSPHKDTAFAKAVETLAKVLEGVYA